MKLQAHKDINANLKAFDFGDVEDFCSVGMLRELSIMSLHILAD